jgi:branched-chain amino acid transport system substrate-binding protein
MTDASRDSATTGGGGAEAHTTPSLTRGFLFADLRGYTGFVESHGAASAADLLLRYRGLAREAIRRYEGAEIRTEGDSFYVVFGSVSGAVQCGLTIAEMAEVATADRPDLPIRVGIGIHAGETVVTPDGYVGSPVNTAARICSLARPGEVLVSDTVRALTQTVLPVRFVPRGRRHLKGVAEPVVLFAVEHVEVVDTAWSDIGGIARRRRRRRWRLAGAAAAATALTAVAWLALRPATGVLPSGAWAIGVSLPLTGSTGALAEPLLHSVQLAVDTANATGGIGGTTIELRVADDKDRMDSDPALGAANATEFVADASVVAMIGPLTSYVAAEQIPITNQAGLLQCSPSSTAPELTKPGDGALELRAAHPDRINFVRLAAAADIESAAAASFAFNDLGASSALVVDDTQSTGRVVADAFEDAFTELGGEVVRRALNPDGDPLSVLDALGHPDAPSLVYFGGFTNSGAAALRLAMVDAGHGDVAFLSWEPVWDGSGTIQGSFIQQAGDAAEGSYVSRPSVGTPRADFERRYRDAYGTAPAGQFADYAPAAHACAEIILAALAGVAQTSATAENVRDAVRAYVVDPAHRFETELGTVGFDANGDSTHQFVALYRVEASAAGGNGDWVLIKQQDFAPAD